MVMAMMTIGGKVSKMILDVSGRLGMILGFSTFYYHKQRKSFVNSKLLQIYSKAMAFAFMVLYPLSLYRSFIKQGFLMRTVTDYARLLLVIVYWILTFLIYLNQTSHSTIICELYNRALTLYRCYEDMYGSENLTNLEGPMGKCAIRVFILLGGFLGINFMKNTWSSESWTTFLEYFLFIYLFVPNLTISLASNRFYTSFRWETKFSKI
jgi:hypothetical protein